MNNFIKDFYEKFLMRDILSFITPGAIIFSSILLLWYNPCQFISILNKIHWLFYIPIFGIFYVIGTAVQSFGSKFPIIFPRIRPIIKLHRLLDRNNSCDYAVLLDFHQNRKQPFKKLAKDNENLDKQHERLVIFKQMCGNCFLAGVIAFIIITIKYVFPNNSIIPPTITYLSSILFLISLYCGHIHSVREESALEETVLS